MEESSTKPLDNGDIFKSPNIRSTDGEELDGPAKMDGAETATPAVDDIPIAEEDIKFRAENIQKHDDSKMFVKIEGAEKRARQAERDKKKKDEELVRKLRVAANIRKREHRKARNKKLAAKHKAARKAIRQKVKTVLHRFRYLIAAAFFIIAGIVIVNSIIIPTINKQQAAQRKEEEDNFVANNKTAMINLFVNLVGKEIKTTELTKLITATSPDMQIDIFEEDGEIYQENNSEESILFLIETKENIATANHFEFRSMHNGKLIKISGAENNFYYSYGDVVANLDDPEAAIRKYILDIKKGNGENQDEKNK